MLIFSEVTETHCIKDRYRTPHSTAEIWMVQDCAAISTIAVFLFTAVYQMQRNVELF